MTPRLKNSLLALGLCTSLGTAVGLAGGAFAAGSLPNPFEHLAQASPPASGTPAVSSTTTTGTPATGTPSSMGTATTPATTPATAPASGSMTAPGGTPPSAGSSTGGTPESNAVFDQLDTNKDGVLSRDEFGRATIRSQ